MVVVVVARVLRVALNGEIGRCLKKVLTENNGTVLRLASIFARSDVFFLFSFLYFFAREC